MYIHNYQIHNILNAYRERLIDRPPIGSRRLSEPGATGRDHVQSIRNAQRQAIMEQVSAAIVDRITRPPDRSLFQNVVWDQMRTPAAGGQNDPFEEFTYTCIDENNCKITGTFEIDTLKALISGRGISAGDQKNNAASFGCPAEAVGELGGE